MKKGIDKLGIVLAGGGGLGSYQIGVLKYLKEVNLTRNIKAISGNSVGALNACLYALDNYELAENIWLNEIQDSILPIGANYIMNNITKGLKERSINLMVAFPFLVPIIQFIAHCGVFSREGLVNIIEKHIDLDYIQNCNIPIYANATNIDNLCLEHKYFKLQERNKDDIIKILLATSAIPFIFPTQTIDGVVYWYGFLSHNAPLGPLYDEGCTDILVVQLEYNKPLKDRREGVRIYEICTQNNLGRFFDGVLDFSPKGANKRIEQGYMDSKAIIGPAVDMAKTQAKIIVDLENMIDSERRYREKLKELKKKKDN